MSDQGAAGGGDTSAGASGEHVTVNVVSEIVRSYGGKLGQYVVNVW